MQFCSIVSFEVVQKYGKNFRSHSCGTGPFQLFSWDEGDAMILHKNKNYWEFDSMAERLPYLMVLILVTLLIRLLSFYNSDMVL